MSLRPNLTIIPGRNTTISLAEEVRELRKLAKDRRAASLALFRNGTKPSTFPRPTGSPRSRKPIAA